MPDPKRYKSTEKDYKRYMNDCMHQVMHMERKKKDQSIAQCMSMWRKEHGSKHPGKRKKKATADVLKEIAAILSNVK